MGAARGRRRPLLQERPAGVGCGVPIVLGAGTLAIVALVALALFVLIPSSGPSAAAVVQEQPGAASWNSAQRTTILLAGTNGASGPASDLIVASYIPASRQLNLLDVPATLWVTVPGYGPATLGQAYADGGTRLLLVTAQSALGISIPYYATAGAGTISRAIGTFGFKSSTSPARMTGITEMNAFLSVIKKAQAPDNRIRLASLLNSLGPSITTNFPLNRVPDLLGGLAHVGADRTDTVTIGPLSDTAIPYTAGGEQVFLPRWDEIRRLTRRLLAGPAPAGAVDVLNGGGVPGQAAALSTWLRTQRIAVHSYATAPAGTYAHTQVVLRPGARPAPRALAQAAATLLQVPTVTGRVRGDSAPVIIIIGRDFENPAQQ